MANETQQLTVADLEVAKTYFEGSAELDARFSGLSKRESIAATCIGIVSEMVKCVKPRRGACSTYRSSEMCEDMTFDLHDDTGWEVGQKFLDREDVDHLAALHNLWLKAVAAFGGEVK